MCIGRCQCGSTHSAHARSPHRACPTIPLGSDLRIIPRHLPPGREHHTCHLERRYPIGRRRCFSALYWRAGRPVLAAPARRAVCRSPAIPKGDNGSVAGGASAVSGGAGSVCSASSPCNGACGIASPAQIARRGSLSPTVSKWMVGSSESVAERHCNACLHGGFQPVPHAALGDFSQAIAGGQLLSQCDARLLALLYPMCIGCRQYR
jgi:hypothetical protein